MEKKRILLVVPRLNIGGAETYVVTVALGLKQAGFEVHVASGGGQLTKTLRDAGVLHHFVPVRLHAALAAKLLEGIARRCRIDLMHANSAAAGIAAVKVKEKLGLPVIYTAHGIFGHNDQEKTIGRCDKIICVSEFVRAHTMRQGLPEEKLTVLYTGIDLHKFSPNDAVRRKIRAALQIEEKDFALALVARIKNLRNKGHEDMLRVLAEYPGAAKWHLLVIGKGNALWKLRWLVWKKGLQSKVHCVGHKTDVHSYLNAADAVVLPSKFETFGLVLAEGMAMEKPAVAYAVGGTPEVIAEGQSGFLATRGELDTLYRKLEILAEDRSLCIAMGKEARAHVAECFSHEKMMKALTVLYQEILGI